MRTGTTKFEKVPLTASKHIFGTLQIAVAAIVSVLILTKNFSQKKSYEDFDLGTGTASCLAMRDGTQIHTSTPDAKFEKEIVEQVEAAKQQVILFLGNSQTHGINQKKEGQQNYVGLASNRYAGKAFVVGHSIPNANLQEHYLIFNYWMKRLPISFVVLPIFYDDLREDNLRANFFAYMARQGLNAPGQSSLDLKLNSLLSQAQSKETGDSDVSNQTKTLQERSEAALNALLEENVSVWRNRSTLRGEFEVFRYRLRNTVFGITPQTKRAEIPTVAKENLAALDSLLGIARANAVQVLLYIPPLRLDVSPPYDMESYRQFKSQMEHLQDRWSHVHFLDLDSIVPGKYWGMKDSTSLWGTLEYDFMHFQYEGHSLLMDALSPTLDQMVSKK